MSGLKIIRPYYGYFIQQTNIFAEIAQLFHMKAELGICGKDTSLLL
jgi:hypothetical protein